MQSCKKINPVLTSFRLRLCLQEHSFGQSRTRKRWASGFSNPPHRDHSTSTKKFLTKKRIPARVGLYRWSLISSVLTDERGVVEHPLRFMTSKRCSWNCRQSCVCVDKSSLTNAPIQTQMGSFCRFYVFVSLWINVRVRVLALHWSHSRQTRGGW